VLWLDRSPRARSDSRGSVEARIRIATAATAPYLAGLVMVVCDGHVTRTVAG
jgi:hypothetical protein